MRSHKKIIFWGDMYQGGEFALQADCEGFDPLSFHQNLMHLSSSLVRTLPFQGSNTGSNPVRCTKIIVD